MPAAIIGLMFIAGCSNSAAPSTGTTAPSGPVTVGVTWNSAADVDLHVVEPSGNEIYWDTPTSPTGGKLDQDANEFCALDLGVNAENITWTSSAPAGTYMVRVDYYMNCGAASTNYIVTVTNGTTTATYPGSFTGIGDFGAAGSGTLVTTFTHSGTSLMPDDSPLNLLQPLSPSRTMKRRLSARE